MRGIGLLCLATACLVVIAAVVPVQASTISYTGSDTTTLGSWRTAAPDADGMYGTDGYILFNYGNGLGSGYDSAKDRYSKPGYISSYTVTVNEGEDGQGSIGPALQDPGNVANTSITQIYNYPHPYGTTDPTTGNLVATFTMATDKAFKLELYAGHGSDSLPWTQSLSVGIGGNSATSSVETERVGVWQIFNIDAKSGDTVTITANCQSTSSGTMLSAVAFDAVPEPGTIMLLVTGAIGLLAYAWRKRK